MKRNMDLVRQILFAVEASEGGYAPSDLEIDGFTESQVDYHAYLICDAELAKGVDTTTRGSDGPEWRIRHLTWAGHEFLDAARPQTRWDQAKLIMGKIGGASLQVWTKVLREQAEQAVTDLIS